MSDHQTLAVYDERVDSYTDLVRPGDENPHLLNFIDSVCSAGLVLDLGCGPAHDAAVMRARGLRVDPVDGSAEMVRVANERYQIGARQALFSDIDGRHVYDGIWANFSLLHASADELPELLLKLHAAIKPAGLFHLAMKTGDGAQRDRLGRYYSYYPAERLEHMLAAAGFAVRQTAHGEALGLAGDVEPWVALLSSPK